MQTLIFCTYYILIFAAPMLAGTYKWRKLGLYNNSKTSLYPLAMDPQILVFLTCHEWSTLILSLKKFS